MNPVLAHTQLSHALWHTQSLPYSHLLLRWDINDTKRLVCAMLLPLGKVVVDLTDYEYGIPKLVHGCLLENKFTGQWPNSRILNGFCKEYLRKSHGSCASYPFTWDRHNALHVDSYTLTLLWKHLNKRCEYGSDWACHEAREGCVWAKTGFIDPYFGEIYLMGPLGKYSL